VILQLSVHSFFKDSSIEATYINFNKHEIIRRMFYGVQIFIPVLLLRTLRFPEIRTREKTVELG